MTNEQMIRELRAVAEKYKGKHVFTCETNINLMATDAANRIESLCDEINRQKAEVERLTEIIKSYDFRDRAVFGNEAFLEQNERTASNVKFETGDFAKIVDCRSGHNFNIGTIVKLEKCKTDYKAFAGCDWWWVTDEDLADVDEDIDNLIKEFTEGRETE